MPPSQDRWWRRLKAAPPGQRFTIYYRARASRRRRGESRWSRPFRLVVALVCTAIALPLMILPGPATLFFALAGLLLAGESAVVARLLDRTEMLVRRLGSRLRSRSR